MAGVHFRRLERLFAQYRSKVEGCLELHFFGSSQRAAGEIFRKELTKSRRLSGAILFRVIAAGRWRDFSKRIDQKPKAVWREYFFGVHFRTLARLFAGYRPKAEGSLELLFFRSSHWAAWGASRSVGKGSRRLSGRNVFSGYISGRWRDFCRELTKSRKLSGAVLFRGTFPKAGVAFRRGSPQSWRRPGLNVFSEHNSEGWWDFSQGIDPKPEAVWREYFFGVHFQRLEGLFAEDLPKAGGGLA